MPTGFWQADCVSIGRLFPSVEPWKIPVAGDPMFRITVVETPSEEKWILQGQLTGEFTSELKANWRTSLDQCSDRLRLVDLDEVTQIDKCGEEVLLQMIHEHARFVASGLYTRHLLEELQASIEGEAHKLTD